MGEFMIVEADCVASKAKPADEIKPAVENQDLHCAPGSAKKKPYHSPVLRVLGKCPDHFGQDLLKR